MSVKLSISFRIGVAYCPFGYVTHTNVLLKIIVHSPSTAQWLLSKPLISVYYVVIHPFISQFFSLFPSACSPGTFKSKQGDSFCLPCPANSRASSGAASVCSCRNGFYRSDTDSPDSPCTSKRKQLLFDWNIILIFQSHNI